MAKKSVTTNDALSTFTASLAQSITLGGTGYRDGPFSGYAKDGTFLNDYYSTSWIARAAVEMIPEDCFKRGYQWVADAEQVTRIEAEERRLNLRKKKKLALTWSRKDGEAYLYFDTGQSPGSPLRLDAVRAGGLRFVNALRLADVAKGPVVKDPMSEFHGQPEYYRIGTVNIHPSRICRFINGDDQVSGNGISVLTYMLGPILSAETARDNTVALTTEALIDVMGVEGLMDAVQDPEMEAAIVRRYTLARTLKATNKMMVIDKEKESFDRKPSTFTTLPEIIETMRREVAAAVGVPYSLLFGRPGGLGSSGDMELQTYYDNISTMQRNDIQPICEPLDECLIRSALGSRPPEIYLDWLSLYEMSDSDKATISKTMAEAAGIAVDKGIVPAEVLTEALINSWVEIGAFQGIEQGYQDWVAAGGVLEPVEEESDVLRGEGGAKPVTDAAPKTLYVSRKVLNGSEILKWAKEQGFTKTLSASDLHVTIAYSRTPLDWMDIGESWQSKIEISAGGPRVIEQFGDAKVVLFRSSELEWRHKSIREAGASWDHAEYQPHITISYDNMPENVQPYQGKIVLGPEVFSEVVDDWRSTIEHDTVSP